MALVLDSLQRGLPARLAFTVGQTLRSMQDVGWTACHVHQPVGADETDQGDQALVSKQLPHFTNAPDVLFPVQFSTAGIMGSCTDV